MTPTTEHTAVHRVEIRADGTSTVWTWNNRTKRDDRADHPADRLPHVRERYCPRADRPHVALLDQIEADIADLTGAFPQLRDWTRSRVHYWGFAMLHLRRAETLINVLVTRPFAGRREKVRGREAAIPPRPATVTVAHPPTRERRQFPAADLTGIYAMVVQLSGVPRRAKLHAERLNGPAGTVGTGSRPGRQE
jgi:hypothetical protein